MLYSKILNKHKCVLNMLHIQWKLPDISNESGKVKIEHYHTTVIIVVIIVACTFHKPMEVVDVRFHIYNCLLIIYLLLVFIVYNYDVE